MLHMRILSVPGLLLLLVSHCANIQASVPCDVNGDQNIDVGDLIAAVDQVLGFAACTTGDLNRDGRCDVTDLQIAVNAILGGTCFATRVIQVTEPFSCTIKVTGPGLLQFFRDVSTGTALVSFTPDGWLDLSQPPPSTVTTDGRCAVIPLQTILFQSHPNVQPLLWVYDVR